MKAWMHLVAAISFSSTLFASAALADGPELVPAPVEKVFVPLGFDDNDNVELIVHGHFPNTCYKTGPTSARVDAAANRVELTVQAFHYRGVGCAMVLVPFTQTIKLGFLSTGTYSVNVVTSPDVQAEPLVIVESRTAGPDDFLYAPVSYVNVERRGAGTEVFIGGEFPLMLVGCMVMKDVEVRPAPGGVVVVQPIAEIVDGAACHPGVYSYKFGVRKTLSVALEGEILAHVRVMNGESVNRFFDLTP